MSMQAGAAAFHTLCLLCFPAGVSLERLARPYLQKDSHVPFLSKETCFTLWV
jgi:hypothetical protein